MVEIISFEGRYSLDDQSLKSIAKFRINDSIKMSCFTITPGEIAGIELDSKSWGITHQTATRDTSLKLKRSLNENASLTISQFIPNNNWYVVPNPALKLKYKGMMGGEHNLLESEWDTLSRSGSTEFTMYQGDDKEYKAAFKVHSREGLVAKARAKLNRGLIHSVAASVGTSRGPQFTLKSRFSEGTKTDLTFDPSNQIVKLHAKHRGEKPVDGKPTPEVLFDVVAPLGKAPKIVVGIKMHF